MFITVIRVEISIIEESQRKKLKHIILQMKK